MDLQKYLQRSHLNHRNILYLGAFSNTDYNFFANQSHLFFRKYYLMFVFVSILDLSSQQLLEGKNRRGRGRGIEFYTMKCGD